MTSDGKRTPDVAAVRSARSVSVEDYVKVIYTHSEWQPTPITGTILAAKLGLSKSSVTEMVQKLDRLGLVEHAPYGAVSLTGSGVRLALEMVRRHRLLETYLVEALDYSWDEVHAEAEVLEHVISPLLLERIDERLGRPRRDPHGDPIPDADGVLPTRSATVVTELPAGAAGRVSRISDTDPALLTELAADGVGLDTRLEVSGDPSGGGAVAVLVSSTGMVLELTSLAAASIWVTIEE